MTETKVQWQPIIEMVIVLVTILGSTIPLYLHTDAKIDKMNELIMAIRDETKAMNYRICDIEGKK